jgi:curli biogenesis system outer membrane secretion channel CsgG
MRLALAIALLALAGCSSKPAAPLPVQPAGPTEPTSLKQAGSTIEAQSQKVAAAVTVIRENSGKEAVVKAESAVALSMLPKPTDEALAVARLRAVNPADQKAYAAAEDYGRKLLSRITADWAKVSTDQAEAKRVSDLKDARIKQLEAEVETIKQEARRDIWTLTGAALAVVGAIATVFAGPRIGVPLLLCGAFCGAVPHIYDSPWFEYIAGATLVISCGLGLWWLTDKVRDSVNEPNCPPPSSDEPPQA